MNKKRLKKVQVSYNISEYDLKYRKNNMRKWLEKGHPVRVQMMLKGRSKYLYTDSLEKLISLFQDFKITNSWHKNNSSYIYINEIKDTK